MKKITSLVVISLFCCSIVLGQESSKTVRNVMQRIQNKMQKHYDWLKKTGTFEDPLGRIFYFFKTVSQESPCLLSNTAQYKDELLNLLIDSTALKKNHCTNMDIEYLLYNMPIDDYVDVLMRLYEMYKQGLIEYQTFRSFLSQDFCVSNSVSKNYQNEKLNEFFDFLLQDEEFINLRCKWSNITLKESIMGLRNGDSWWDDEAKRIEKIQPPILDSYDGCKLLENTWWSKAKDVYSKMK